MSQSPSALSPSPSSHSRALFATSGCSRSPERPLAQERDRRGIRQPEEEVLGGLEHRRGAGQRRVRILEIGRRVDRAAVLARVAVLVLRPAHRALALDVAVRQEHLLHRIEELLDRARVDQARGLELAVDVLRQLDVLGRVGRMPVVEADEEAVEVLRPRRGDTGDELLRRHAFALRFQHDRRAVGIVRADEVHLVSLHPLEAHPHVGLDVLHDVADVERAVRIRQGRGDEQLAARGAHCRSCRREAIDSSKAPAADRDLAGSKRVKSLLTACSEPRQQLESRNRAEPPHVPDRSRRPARGCPLSSIPSPERTSSRRRA